MNPILDFWNSLGFQFRCCFQYSKTQKHCEMLQFPSISGKGHCLCVSHGFSCRILSRELRYSGSCGGLYLYETEYMSTWGVSSPAAPFSSMWWSVPFSTPHSFLATEPRTKQLLWNDSPRPHWLSCCLCSTPLNYVQDTPEVKCGRLKKRWVAPSLCPQTCRLSYKEFHPLFRSAGSCISTFR